MKERVHQVAAKSALAHSALLTPSLSNPRSAAMSLYAPSVD
jgi:hypothetical protein